jgi:hypothetical protein
MHDCEKALGLAKTAALTAATRTGYGTWTGDDANQIGSRAEAADRLAVLADAVRRGI